MFVRRICQHFTQFVQELSQFAPVHSVVSEHFFDFHTDESKLAKIQKCDVLVQLNFTGLDSNLI